MHTFDNNLALIFRCNSLAVHLNITKVDFGGLTGGGRVGIWLGGAI